MSEYLNAVCKVCGRKYHHCEKCEQIGSWRTVACSPECWNIWVDVVRERKAAEAAAKSAISAEKMAEDNYTDSRFEEDKIDANEEEVAED